MIRLFAALAIPDDVAEDLARRQRDLPGARWTLREDLHVTLRFFGEVDEATASDLDGELAGIGAAAFDLRLSGAGTFGDAAAVRAVFARVEPCEPLARLAAKCEAAARRCGLKPEPRAFRPHVTLAYLKETGEARAAAWLAEHNLLSTQSFRAERFDLYSSWRVGEGPRYQLERAYPLQEPRP